MLYDTISMPIKITTWLECVHCKYCTLFMWSFLWLLNYVMNTLPLFRNSQKSTSVFVWLQLKTKNIYIKMKIDKNNSIVNMTWYPLEIQQILQVNSHVYVGPLEQGFKHNVPTRNLACEQVYVWDAHASSRVTGAVSTPDSFQPDWSAP